MDEKRKAEVTRALLRLRLWENGLTLSSSTNRKLGAFAKESGTSLQELRELLIEFLPDFLGEALGADFVSIRVGYDDLDGDLKKVRHYVDAEHEFHRQASA
ncbi:MAG TPA: hypothetical protein PK109_00595 [Candidatus Paceibacterota bacterium]|nr:hypothetical protein [Candidatus Paceibacterota bacterium]